MSLFPESLKHQAAALLAEAERKGIRIATAESCTGGLVAAMLTEIAGSSSVVECGFVTYSNEAKQTMLGVRAETLARVGAVSDEVAREMAEGALQKSRAQRAVSITGIAGPSGGSEAKPVGLVFLAVAGSGRPTESERCQFTGSRADIRLQAVEKALELLKKQL